MLAHGLNNDHETFTDWLNTTLGYNMPYQDIVFFYLDSLWLDKVKPAVTIATYMH